MSDYAIIDGLLSNKTASFTGVLAYLHKCTEWITRLVLLMSFAVVGVLFGILKSVNAFIYRAIKLAVEIVMVHPVLICWRIFVHTYETILVPIFYFTLFAGVFGMIAGLVVGALALGVQALIEDNPKCLNVAEMGEAEKLLQDRKRLQKMGVPEPVGKTKDVQMEPSSNEEPALVESAQVDSTAQSAVDAGEFKVFSSPRKVTFTRVVSEQLSPRVIYDDEDGYFTLSNGPSSLSGTPRRSSFTGTTNNSSNISTATSNISSLNLSASTSVNLASLRYHGRVGNLATTNGTHNGATLSASEIETIQEEGLSEVAVQ